MFWDVFLPVILILVVLLSFSVPVYVALLTATLYMTVFVNNMPITSVFTGMFEALTKNALLAVPFFVVAGNMLATSSLGERLVNFCEVLLKKIPGGLALSAILANAIFGAISGSAPAATGTFGKILWKPLKENYGEEEAAGIITSAGSLSPIIPPSLSLIMYGIVTETSLADLFMAGFMPGVLCVAVLGIYLFVKHRHDVADAKFAPGEINNALRRGIPALLLPVIILGGIYGGFCSPTEAGAIAALYSMIVALFFTKDLKFSQLFSIFKDSSKTIGQLFILIATSNAFSQALTVTRAPQTLQDMMNGRASPVTFLLFLNVLLLIMGCFFDPGAAVMIVCPILVPIGLSLGLDIVHLGVIFAVNLSIGMFTPPFGLSLFVSQSVLQQPMGKIVRGCTPFLVCFLISLLFITFIPDISLWLGTVLK